MNPSTAFKPLLVAAVLAVSVSASAATRALPQAVPSVYFVPGSDFNDTFTFSVGGRSSIAGGVGSTMPYAASPSQPVTFTAITLTGSGRDFVSAPERENYAMFLAGLGIVGAMVRRRSV